MSTNKDQNKKFKMDQVDILELKNIMIEMKNLLPEFSGRLEKAGVRIGSPENRTLEIENQRGKKWKKNEQRSRDCKTSTHLTTYRCNGSPGKTVEREKGKKMYLMNKYL